jgi:hypothetical protein
MARPQCYTPLVLLYLNSQKPPFNVKLHGGVIDTFPSIAIDDDFLLAFFLLPWVLHPSMGLYCNVIMGDPPHPKILFFCISVLTLALNGHSGCLPFCCYTYIPACTNLGRYL